MRTANLSGRLALIRDQLALDVELVSQGRFGPDPQAVFDVWPDFTEWASGLDADAGSAYDEADLGPVVPRPRQIFAVGLNYAAHAAESGLERPAAPLIFTKYSSSLSGPHSTVVLPTATVDWEVELVVVIGRSGRQVTPATAWAHVAGVTVGQDISERTSQHAGPAPQFGLAKSFSGFSPIGPVLLTVDELSNPDDLGIGCSVNGETVQSARTSDMIFAVPDVIAYLSTIVTLYPGDLIFTGTPDGVGAGRTPPRYLRADDRLDSWIEGIGTITQTFLDAPRAAGDTRSLSIPPPQ